MSLDVFFRRKMSGFFEGCVKGSFGIKTGFEGNTQQISMLEVIG